MKKKTISRESVMKTNKILITKLMKDPAVLDKIYPLTMQSYSFEYIQKEALKYKTRVEFAKGSAAAYSAAHRLNIMKEICSHITPKASHTLESIQLEALKYKTRGEFLKNSKGGYQAARRLGVLDQVCKHMVSGRKKAP